MIGNDIFCAHSVQIYTDSLVDLLVAVGRDENADKGWIDKILSNSEQVRILECVRQLGMYRCLGLITGNIEVSELTSLELDLYGKVMSIVENSKIKKTSREILKQIYLRHDFDTAQCWSIYKGSRFWGVAALEPIICEIKQIKIIPSLFMPEASSAKGQFGYFKDGCLTLLFGPLVDADYDWEEWFRFGVWYTMSYGFWSRMYNELELPLYEMHAEIAEIPPELLYKVNIPKFRISTYSSWQAYLINNLNLATIWIAKEETGNFEDTRAQMRFMNAVGNFSLSWFFGKLKNNQWNKQLLESIIDQWSADIEQLKGFEVVFSGPLAVCHSPIWKDKIRLMFSPSISARARRMIQLYCTSLWGIVKSQVCDEASIQDSDWNRYCNVIYGLKQDADWISSIVGKVRNLQQLADYDLLTFAQRNGGGMMTWSRYCFGETEDHIVAESGYQDIMLKFEWFAVRKGSIDGGDVRYVEDECLLSAQKSDHHD